MRERNRRRRGLPLTVCVAARCADNSIFCAADRMITVGDIEMESPATKIFGLSNSIVIMPSDDDAALHTEILIDTYSAVAKMIADDPRSWPIVKEVVGAYVNARNAKKSKLAEQTFLSPFGLTRETFLDKMMFMDSKLVSQISEDLVSYKMPSMSVIIVGQDTIGSHIYEVHDGETGCFNSIGYSAIGAGARHARAHFMMSNQSNATSATETLWAVYLAKKRAEVAPGVGEVTDLALIGPRLGGVTMLNDARLAQQLQTVYKKTKRMEERARKVASKEMVQYVERIDREAQQIAATATPTPESPPRNEGKLAIEDTSGQSKT